MYKPLEKKDKIQGYNLEVEDLFFQVNEKDEFIVFTEEYSTQIDNEVFGNPFYWKDYLVFSNVNKKKSSFWVDGKEVLRKEFDSVTHVGDYLITYHKKDRKKYVQFLNEDFEVIFEKEFKIGKSYASRNLFVSGEVATANKINVFLINDTIQFYSIDITDEQWTNLEGEEFNGEVFQIIGQWKNQLLVFIGKFRFVSFDLRTGKELWRIDDFIKEVSSNPIFDFTNGVSAYVKWHLSGSEDEAYLLVRNCLFELDLNNKKSELIKDYNESTEQEWYFKHSRLYDDYITFSGANVLGKFPMVAGVIDRNTKEILWTTRCESGIYFEEAPQIKDNKLFILDSSQTLHIFERE